MICDGVGRMRDLTTMRCRCVSAAGKDSGWKQLTRQAPMLGQTFCGQPGHGLAGLWHGIWSCADAADIGPLIASAIDVVSGTTTSAPSMAAMPRTTKQR